MKKTFLILSLLSCLSVFSQTYPFANGFEGEVSNQAPAGWGGGMKVLLDHGLNDSKGLSARVSSGVVVDSSVTPLVGPLTAQSAISFYYAIINQANYPSTPTDLDGDDKVEVMLSTDGTNYQTIYQIDMNNHNPSFNFVKRKIYLAQYAGSTVNFKLRCQYGTGPSFFVDFDTLAVVNDPQAGIDEVNSDAVFSLFPNPCPAANGCALKFNDNTPAFVKVFSALGELVYYSPNIANCLLPTAYWSPGIYFVQSGNVTRKLIIE